MASTSVVLGFGNPAQVAANTAKIGAGTIAVQGAQGSPTTDLTSAINQIAALSAQNAAYGFFHPSVNNASLATSGMTGFTAIGTASGGAQSDTNWITRRARVVLTSAASAGSAGGAQAVGGSSSGPFSRNTGFAFQMIFAPLTTSPACRLFCGFGPNFGVSDFLAAVDCLGIGTRGGAGSNLKIISNDGSGNIAEVDLGANFPVSNNAAYLAWFYCAPGGSTIYYRVRRLDTVVTDAIGTITSDLPTATAFTGYPQMQLQNATDAQAVVLAILGWDQWIPYS